MTNPTTEEIVAALRRCATGEGDGCKSCTIKPMINKDPYVIIGCAETLQLIAADRLEKLEAALNRLGKFGALFMDYDGDPRGAKGRMGNATLAEEALYMDPITDADGNEWIPVQADVLRELCNQNRWIPVTERLPEEFKNAYGEPIKYLCYIPEYGIDIGYYIKIIDTWVCGGFRAKVTHWMPMPEPPKEE